MGVPTPNNIFYKPDIGASGATEKGKFDDGLDTGDGLIEANKPANNKLSAFAPTTSAELAGVITDKIGAGKLRFDNSVTIITGATTLTPAQAGFIGVSASAPYTLYLPDPAGLKGLFYRVKKTDYNYNLITIAAVAGQFYYTNDQGTVKTTYPRLNTGGAEALFATDGINWYVFAERPGQVPEARVYSSTPIENLLDNTPLCRVPFDSNLYDIGDNYDYSVWISGAADGYVDGHLQDDTNSQFTAEMVGYRVKNTTNGTYAWITAVNDAGDITLSWNAFPLGNESYTIYHSEYICPVDGSYFVNAMVNYKDTTVVANKIYGSYVFVNGISIYSLWQQSSMTLSIFLNDLVELKASKGDKVTLIARHKAGVDTVDVYEGATYFIIRLIKKA